MCQTEREKMRIIQAIVLMTTDVKMDDRRPTTFISQPPRNGPNIEDRQIIEPIHEDSSSSTGSQELADSSFGRVGEVHP